VLDLDFKLVPSFDVENIKRFPAASVFDQMSSPKRRSKPAWR
jgi:hypothetical protein